MEASMRCCCLLTTYGGSTMNKCTTCFYALMDKDLEAPCAGCTGYSNYVKGAIYMTKPSHDAQPLKEAIDEWFDGVNGVTTEDFWGESPKGLTQEDYDSVSKPRHYMLFDEDAVISFEGKGIEVRDVIEKLVNKAHTAIQQDDYPQGYSKPMFIADYVQMMQYLMRFMDKNGVEDLKKASWYLDKLIEAYESDV